jgi:hypothetical protein
MAMDKLADITASLIEKQLSSAATGLQPKHADGSLRQVLAERMTFSEAIEAVKRILACYSNGGGRSSDGYIGLMAQTLGSYPRQIALRCAEPLFGVVREHPDFMPNVGQVIAWCEKETAPLRNQIAREDRVAQIARERAEDAKLWREPHLTIDELKAKYGDWTGQEEKEARLDGLYPPPEKRDSDRDLKASPELVKAMQEKHAFEQAQGKDESPHWSEGS